MEEKFKTIENFPKYKISNKGYVISTHFGKEKILKMHTTLSGYLYVNAYNKDGRKKLYIHREVAKHFCYNDDIENKICVNHIDENKTNNYSNNLEWCTYSYNLNYGSRQGWQKKYHSKKVKALNIKTNKIEFFDSKNDFMIQTKGKNNGAANRALNNHLSGKKETFYDYRVLQID